MSWAYPVANRRMVSNPEARLHSPEAVGSSVAWLFGGALTVALCLLFVLGTPSAPFWLATSALLLSWWVWAFKHPLAAFACLVFVWVTVYARASLPIFQVEGGDNRGGLALGDIMWLLFTTAWTIAWLRMGRGRFSASLINTNIASVSLIAYVLLSIVLPLLGILLHNYPLSYITPGIRILQVAMLSVAICQLIGTYGLTAVVQCLLGTLALSGLLHAVQALLQILVFMEIAPVEWLVLDHMYKERFAQSWFHYPRTTGLWVTPMQYGPFGMFLLLMVEAWTLVGMPLSRGLKAILYVSALCALLTSASRAGIVGAAAGLLMMYLALTACFLLMGNAEGLFNLASVALKRAVGIAVVLLFVGAVVPEVLLQRVALLGTVATQGAQYDPNTAERLELWREALNTYEQGYVWGTLVPSSFVVRHEVGNYTHNFYIDLILQGTPFYLFVFLLMLVSFVWRGWQMCTESKTSSVVASGLSVIGATIGLAFVLLTDNKIHMAQFWIAIGFGLIRRGQ